MKTAFPALRSRQAPQPVWTDPQLRRRHRQGGGQPIAMVVTLAAGTLAGMMLAPASGSAFSSSGAPADAIEAAHTTPKTWRLPRVSAVAATKALTESGKAPGACAPAPVAPARSGPVAYV